MYHFYLIRLRTTCFCVHQPMALVASIVDKFLLAMSADKGLFSRVHPQDVMLEVRFVDKPFFAATTTKWFPSNVRPLMVFGVKGAEKFLFTITAAERGVFAVSPFVF